MRRQFVRSSGVGWLEENVVHNSRKTEHGSEKDNGLTYVPAFLIPLTLTGKYLSSKFCAVRAK